VIKWFILYIQMPTAESYQEEHNSEFILSELEFYSLQEKIIPEILEALNELGIKDEEHSEKIKIVKDAFPDGICGILRCWAFFTDLLASCFCVVLGLQFTTLMHVLLLPCPCP
jgi:hypothetical protein